MQKLNQIFIADERYGQMYLEVMQTNGTFNFEESFDNLASIDIDSQHRSVIQLHKHYSNFLLGPKIPKQYQKQLISRLKGLALQPNYPILRLSALQALVIVSRRIQDPILLVANRVAQHLTSFIRYENPSQSRIAIAGLGKLAYRLSEQIQKSSFDAIITYYQRSEDKNMDDSFLLTLARLLPSFVDVISPTIAIKLVSLFKKPLCSQVLTAWVIRLHRCFKKEMYAVLFDSGSVSSLIYYLSLSSFSLIPQCLQILSRITAYSKEYADRLINLRIIKRIEYLCKRYVRYIQGTVFLVVTLFNSKNMACKKQIANSEFILRKLLQNWKKQPSFVPFRLNICQFFSQIIPFGDSFKLYSLYKEFDFVRAYLYERYITQLLQFLPAVLELGEKFKENGRNVFVDQLYKKGTVERWQMNMLRKDQKLVSLISLIFYRFIDP